MLLPICYPSSVFPPSVPPLPLLFPSLPPFLSSKYRRRISVVVFLNELKCCSFILSLFFFFLHFLHFFLLFPLDLFFFHQKYTISWVSFLPLITSPLWLGSHERRIPFLASCLARRRLWQREDLTGGRRELPADSEVGGVVPVAEGVPASPAQDSVGTGPVTSFF